MALFFTGCTLLQAIKPVERDELLKADEEGNVEFLKSVCAGDKRVRYSDDKRKACNMVKRHEAANVDCSNVVEAYENTPKNSEEFVGSMATKLAECGEHTFIFEHVVHWGNNAEGARILAKLEKEGQPMEEKFVEYASSHKGKAFLPKHTKFSLDYIGKWLIKKGSTGHCALIADAVKDGTELAKVWAFPYFKDAKCAAEGVPIAAEVLLSDSAQHRIWACATLGKLGDASVLGKVETLATTDAYSEIVEERTNSGSLVAVKVWPVRDACTAAAGKIKLRSQ